MAESGILFQDIVASTGQGVRWIPSRHPSGGADRHLHGGLPSDLRALRASDRHAAVHAGSGFHSLC